MYGWREGHMPATKPPADAKAVWEISSAIEDGAGSIHPTMKPVELIRRPIGYHTAAGDLIYEPFSGSGTAIIAAEMSRRRCYALELAPAFVDRAVLRWQRFTGKEATLESDGRAFAEISAERSQSATEGQ
jgi:DNA modification methylase